MAPDVEYTFSTRAIDDDGDDIQYYFVWGDGFEEMVPVDYYVPSGTIVEVNHSWERIGIYEIKVKAIDVHGYESEWNSTGVVLPINRLMIVLYNIYLYYGYLNDILVRLNVNNFRVLDIPMPAKYQGEKSSIKYRFYIPKVSFLLLRRFLWRLWGKFITALSISNIVARCWK